MVTFTVDSQRRARAHAQRSASSEITLVVAHARRRRAARAPPCSTRRPRSRRARPNAVLVYRAFNERSGPPLRPAACRRPGSAPPLDWYSTFGLDTPAKMYALWFHRYMHALRRDQRRLRPLHGRRPAGTRRPTRTRGSTSGRSRSTTTRRRAGSSSRPAAARLLPGERRRRRAGRHPRRPRPATSPQPVGASMAAADAHLGNGAASSYNYYHDDLATFPEAAAVAPPALARAGLSARRHRRRR